MTLDSFRHAEKMIARRFKAVSSKDRIVALLRELALHKEQYRPELQSFDAEMHADVPDTDEYLRMKRKMSLLPLDRITDKIKLPTLPGVVLRLQQALEEMAPVDRIAEIIRFDPKLSAAILSLVNSPLYALPARIETIERAVVVIGSREISSLALGARVLSMFEDCSTNDFSLESFWKHSIATAVLAYDLSVLCGRESPERFFAAGLLHDLGRAMLFSRYPETAKVVLSMHLNHEVPLLESEKIFFDVNHTLIGGIFFAEWKLPSNIIRSALYHHDPNKCLGDSILEIIYVANQIATALGFGCARYYTLESGESIWENLNIEKAPLFSMVEGVDKRLWAMFCSLFPKAKECQ